jgi:hypothetical protein
MANLPESAIWENGIFQLETTTFATGGPDGPANVQARELANRTQWLKQFAEELVAARGDMETLAERLDRYDVFDPEAMSALATEVSQAIESAATANQEGIKTIQQRIQSGEVTIVNRGVISGCVVTKSASAVRNLSLAAGSFFMLGMEMPCPAYSNAALVPPNYGDVEQYCYAYIYLNSDKEVTFACTPLGGTVPEGGLALYRLTVPAGNTEINDPNLGDVTMTDVRRVETAYPGQFNSLAYASVALPYDMIDAEYNVLLEVIDYKGGYNQRPVIHAGAKAANGFNIYAEGTLDAVRVRWVALKMSL